MQKSGGFVIPLIIVVIAAVIVGGFFYMQKSSDDAMMEDDKMEGDEMMEEGDTTMEVPAPGHEGVDEMIVDDGSMMEDGKMEGEMMEGEGMMEEDSSMDESSMQTPFTGALLAGGAAPLLDFVQKDYEKALSSKKVVVLYFYANWCPICKKEFPKMQSAFDTFTNSDVIGFRVNYNDNETDQQEKDLARQFGVAYQHTKVILKDGERVLKSPESWEEDRYITEINAIAMN